MDAWLPLAGVALGGAITVVVSLIQSKDRVQELERREQIDTRANLTAHRRELIASWRAGIASTASAMRISAPPDFEPLERLPYSDWFLSLAPHTPDTTVVADIRASAMSTHLLMVRPDPRQEAFALLERLAGEVDRIEQRWELA